MITSLQQFEQVFLYAWRDDATAEIPSILSVVYEPLEAGRRWLLWAGSPAFREFVPFEDAAHVREFAQALLDLPTAAGPYSREVDLAEDETDERGEGDGIAMRGSTSTSEWCYATLTVGREADRACLPYLNYRSYYVVPGRPDLTSPGLQVFCGHVDVDRLHAEARALLAALDDEG
ncbi:hypothetical protein [Streptomyces bugieae]|uniref:Uncharacterized protein n=1 Tax=Streptomyces bugieae TaxID=3098223 RepID=A0ABU7NU48_9ACTN|nr:hypothetical protein [Streptomyces sp. DSM 41528]